MSEIILRPEQRDYLINLPKPATAMYAEHYRYIASLLPPENPARFWFERAAEINGNMPTATNMFIRGVTYYGLSYGWLAAPVRQAAICQLFD